MSEKKKKNEEEKDMENENLKDSEVNEDLEFEDLEEDDNVSNDNEEPSLEFLQDRLRKVEEEKNKFFNEVEAYQDRLTRLQAEFDNYKRRTAKEKEGIFSDATVEILKEVLPVLDNLERAINVEGNGDDIKKGVDMTLKQFQNALSKLSIEEIPTTEGFNPSFHEAVMHVEDENFGTNEITDVFLKGYRRGDKIIRHSMVKVAN